MIRLSYSLLMGLVLVLASLANAQDSSDPTADAQLAERVADIGQRVLRDKNITDLHWKQSRELIKAASRMAPSEQRFSRLLADIQLQLQDRDGAIEALRSYRLVNPSDAFAQIQLIDLYAIRMETVDAKIKYLRDIMGTTTLPPEVRSHAAWQCSTLLREQGQADAATSTLDQALRLYPLNPEALRTKLPIVRTSGTPLEHIGVLVALVKSNPTQADVIHELADRLSGLGLNDWAIYWYGLSFQLLNSAGAVDPDAMVNHVSALYLQDKLQDAVGLNDQLLKIRPENVDLQFLRLLMSKSSMKKEDLEQAQHLALNSLYNQLAMARGKLGVSGATTRPFDQADAPVIPDVTGDQALLKANAKPEVVAEYVRAAADLAWFQLYFQRDAAAAEKIISILKGTLPEDNVTLNRLIGWSDLVAGRTQEAKDKLSQLDDRDPLAAMGLILIIEKEPEQADKAKTMARRVLSDNASGVRGALLWDGLRDHGGRIVLSQSAEAVNEELTKFPKDFLDVITKPQNFYAVKGEPSQPSYGFNEPMLAKVTFQNVSEHTLTIGPAGIIKRDMWFDAQTKGVVQHAFPGIAYDRFGQHVVLHPRQSLTQIVRVDREALQQAMSSQPTMAIQVSVSLTTNPQMRGDQLISGLCGYRAPFARLFSRSGSRIMNDDDKAKALRMLAEGTPSQKFYMLDLLAVYAQGFMANNANAQMQQIGSEFVDAIGRARRDANPAVAAWAQYTSIQIQPEAARPDLLKQMLANPNWMTRLAGTLAAPILPVEQGKASLQPIADNDADASVKTLAALQIEQLNRPPATQPTTQPAQ